MADEAVVHIEESSPEYVAYRLFKDVVSTEGRALYPRAAEHLVTADRAYILDTYTECLRVVRRKRRQRP